MPARAYREVIRNTLCLPLPALATHDRDLEMRYSGQLESRVRIPLAPPNGYGVWDIVSYGGSSRPSTLDAFSGLSPNRVPESVKFGEAKPRTVGVAGV